MERITERPANGFNTRVFIRDDFGFTRRAWARYTEGSDIVELIMIQRNGDFNGLIRKVNKSQVIVPDQRNHK